MATPFSWDDCYDRNLEVAPNSDVSGLGVGILLFHVPSLPVDVSNKAGQVIIGFLGTGWFVTLLVFGFYLAGFDPASQFYRPGDRRDGPLEDSQAVAAPDGAHGRFLPSNPVDEIILALFHRVIAPTWLRGVFDPREKVLNALQKVSILSRFLA